MNKTNIIIKNNEQIDLMRTSGKLLAQVFAFLDQHIKEGISTMQINDLADDYIRNTLHSRPASKGQYGFPYSLNTSTNIVVCHGVPSEKEILKEGDIINVDITLEKNGYIADSSKMYMIGQVSPHAKRLVDATYEAMCRGIKIVKPGATLGDIGYAIASFAHANGYSVVREFTGHGIGQEMHEHPNVFHYGKQGEGVILQKGMTFTIEPMINQGKAKIRTLGDGWTVITRDKKLSAQWEHTIAVTETGYEVLTLREGENI